ncbi:hypothetical protein Salpa_4966 [Sporomusa sp. KB1]|jgi:hypothetical protein|nr:hypothetical protein Salpa_4966 [Sporomusa sp. KB1]
MDYAKKIDALRQAVSQYEREHGTLSTCISDQTAVGCIQCHANCYSDCTSSCASSCFSSCRSSYAK